MSRGRDVLLPSVTDLLRGRGRRAARPSVHYLVSTAGHPNYGDELITRAWLDYLGQKRADDIVWLDCPRPRVTPLRRHAPEPSGHEHALGARVLSTGCAR